MMRNPIDAGQPIRIKSRINIPDKANGKTVDINKVCILISMILKSFDKRLVILPSSDDFTTNDVILDILV